MNQYIHATKDFIVARKTEAIITIAAVLILALLTAVFLYNLPKPTVVTIKYKATNACSLFTPDKAESLLGDRVISHGDTKPVLSGKNIAISKCGYTDTNPDQNQMLVAAVAIRSAVNDGGVQQNKAEFAAAKSVPTVQPVTNLGDSAFFDQQLGQLDILSGHMWIIVSYGTGATPQDNTLDNALALARKIVPTKS